MSFLPGFTPKNDSFTADDSKLNDTTAALNANIDQFKTAESRA